MASNLTLALCEEFPSGFISDLLVKEGFPQPEASDEPIFENFKAGCAATQYAPSERGRVSYQEAASMPMAASTFVAFHLAKHAPFEAAQGTCYAAIRAILRYTACDASLHFDIASVPIRRINGELFLYADDGHFDPETHPNLLNDFDLPYTMLDKAPSVNE